MREIKKPKNKHLPRGKSPRGGSEIEAKSPRSVEVSTPQRNPVWSFSFVDVDGPRFGNDRYPFNLDAATATRLQKLETMTWKDIESHEHHFVPVKDLCSDAQKRLVEINREDFDELFSLRVCSALRIWGIRINEVFHILWCDPEHKVCPSKNYKK